MQLMNIMNQLAVQSEESEKIQREFNSKVVSYSAVRDYLMEIRGKCIVQ